MYDLFEGEEDQSTECSFIESIRFGTYDESGQFAGATSTSSKKAEVTIDQEVMLGIAIGLVVFFVIYACYIHHSMTNLLIKSLSHRELLPPNKGRKSPGRSRSAKGQRSKGGDEPDWDASAKENIMA
jgi:hypothetical protein